MRIKKILFNLIIKNYIQTKDKKLKITTKCSKNFTYIEVLLVIICIGIIAGFSYPNFSKALIDNKMNNIYTEIEILERYSNFCFENNQDLKFLIDTNINTIYESLQITLENYNDNEEYLYKIDLSKIDNSLRKNIKHGYGKSNKDFYVYSIKTGKVYYYDCLKNYNNTIQHSKFDTNLKETREVEKQKSFLLES